MGACLPCSSNSLFGEIKPGKHLKAFNYRDRSTLPFLGQFEEASPEASPRHNRFYIDTLRGKISSEVVIALRSGSLWHSSVTEAQLAALSMNVPPHRDVPSPGLTGNNLWPSCLPVNRLGIDDDFEIAGLPRNPANCFELR